MTIIRIVFARLLALVGRWLTRWGIYLSRLSDRIMLGTGGNLPPPPPPSDQRVGPTSAA